MPTASENKTTRFEYNLDGNMTKLIAENPTTGNQVTEWIYGVTVAQGSALESKALVYQKVYPDSTDTADRVTYTYNRQGQGTTMTDQAGTIHSYSYDKLGRILEDAATFPSGSDLDQTVTKITRSYEVRGMLETVSSIGSGPTVLNQVQLAYNAYAQLARDYQSHSGPVNPASTLNVAYSYADGSANTVRRTGTTYPDGTTIITTAYIGTDADALSRPDALKEGGDPLCSYRYLGAGVFIGVKYDAASDVELTYEDGGTGDAGDKYTGLDRFGRLIETLWKKGAAAQVHSQYGRNRFGGVVWRKDLAAHAQSVTTEDNYYTYDDLYQVKDRQRGNLTVTPPIGITALQQEEDWTYDATGNWQSYSNTAPTSAQARINNKANEITLLSSSAGGINPDYDPAGNMLTLPTAPGTGTGQYTLKWDAWNRLVEVKDGSTTVAAYTYDGAFRRLTITSAGQTRHFYYNRQWRTVEERIAGATITVERQYTWGLRDRWDLLRRKGTTSGSLDEVHFCLDDYLDPVAIVGEDGLVNERHTYDIFGNVRFLSPDYNTRAASACGWDWLFHGEFRDVATGLYNYGFRYYDTSLGWWLSRDPIREQGGTNLYRFPENDPLSGRDYVGLMNPTNITSDLKEKGGKYSGFIYSCYCGWIDAAHLNVGESLVDQIVKGVNRKTGRLKLIGAIYILKDLSPETILDIVTDYTSAIEKKQAEKWFSNSGFALEDMTSNYLGALLALGTRGMPGGLTLDQLKEKCGVLSVAESNIVRYQFSTPPNDEKINPKLWISPKDGKCCAGYRRAKPFEGGIEHNEANGNTRIPIIVKCPCNPLDPAKKAEADKLFNRGSGQFKKLK